MQAIWNYDVENKRPTDTFLTLKEMSFADAQGETNFVVFSPTWLPNDCHVAQITLRPEQAPGRPENVDAAEHGLTPWSQANPSSLRAVIHGRDRRLRIKQFLYDWAVPAASTAPLWKSERLIPFACQDAIAWLGADYMQRPGACVQRRRTQIEISVEDGSFSDDELRGILRSMQMADPERAAAVEQVPFHRLNYFMRYQVVGPDVPYGLWKYRHARRYSHGRMIEDPASLTDPPVPVPQFSHPAYRFDSGAVIEKPEENHREVELIFRHRENFSDHLWLTAINSDSALSLPSDPQPEEHPAERRRKESLAGRSISYASLTERHGAWEAWWREGEIAIALWAGASQFLDGDAFRDIVSEVKVTT